ncbi:hypothetical protein [Kitasatospora sp. NPDC050543]|uniref:hypothetical protein n=1 Tax=Kitasatospora sp. NPDC050543 TaxID=3364054 RepID=UPI0037AEA9E0
MSATDADPSVSVTLELAEIHRIVDVGFAQLEGQLALMLQRAVQSDEHVAELKAEVSGLRQEVEELQRGRWPLPAVGALTALAALTVALVQLLSR